MTIYIDGDGCPVTDLTIEIANLYDIETVIVCDTAHVFDRDVRVVVVGKGPDSVDFAMLKMIQEGDLVVTQDYGLAALCLTRRAKAIHQDGWFYTEDIIDGLLTVRQASKKMRQAGHRVKGPSKRTKEQNDSFRKSLNEYLAQVNNSVD